jgi:hypothetical protein
MAKPNPKEETPQESLADDLLIREVDEELRAEKLRSWWQRFGSALVTACVLAVLATIAYQWVTHHRQTEAESLTAVLIEAQKAADKNQTNKAVSLLTPLSEESTALADFAKLKMVNLLQEDSKGESNKLLETLGKESTHSSLSDFALLQSSDFEKINENSAFYPLAQEQKALHLLEQGQREEANSILLSLLDRTDLPQQQRQRLNDILEGAR